ncbi:MAG: polyprenol monophosphomannose synthase [Bacteroidales bacterium]|nr:polyprenol monophosphomannose synthase [Bacteroidales bacterium]
MSRSIVIIPTYNEKENIEKMIRKVFSLYDDFSILVVDDGSPDGTGSIVKGLQTEFPDRLFLMERGGKLGLGTAYLQGFAWALERNFDFIFEMDADFSHNPEDLARLKAACENNGSAEAGKDARADLAVGSRYCNGISVINWPIGRVLISYFASVFVRKVLNVRVFDCTSGFVCYSRRVLETLNLDKVRMKGYGFQIEMKYSAIKLGFRLKEVPIIFVDRKEGSSKMSGSILGEAFWGVLALRFRRIRAK